MSSTVYLFEPASDPAPKPLAQIMREAEIARALEMARIAGRIRTAVSDFFDRITSSDDEVAARSTVATKPANDDGNRIAA